MDLPQQETATSVYRYYDQYGILIYVGITKRGVTRNLEHNLQKPWWSLVASQEVDHFPSRELAHAREVELIEVHQPPFNVQHNKAYREMNAVYCGVADQLQSTAHLSAGVMLTGMGGKLPLHVVELARADETWMVFRSEAAHAKVALRMAIVGRPALRVAHGMGIGEIASLEHRGPFVVLKARTRRDLVVDRADAVLRHMPGKGGNPTFEIKRINIVETPASLAARAADQAA